MPAVPNANPSEAAVICIDVNPLNPPTGGANGHGSLAGFNNDDGTDFASLLFRAQFVPYFKDGDNEYRRPGGNIGTTATYTQYFEIDSTANGASTPPFSNEDPAP